MRGKIIYLTPVLAIILLGVSLLALWDDKDNLVFSDSNCTIVIAPITYEPKEHLKEICWVRALTKLAQIYEDPNITNAWMIVGWHAGNAHSWIEYQHSNEIIRYDPTFDFYLEPYPKDANLLVRIIPKEPNEALEIIYSQ